MRILVTRSLGAIASVLVFTVLSIDPSISLKALRVVAYRRNSEKLLRINEFSYKIVYYVRVANASNSSTLQAQAHQEYSRHSQYFGSNFSTPSTPPPITYPVCLSQSDYRKAFGKLAFPDANQLPVYSWDGGPGCPAGNTKNQAKTPGANGPKTVTSLPEAIDQLWSKEGSKLLPAPMGSFDPPTGITGAKVYLVSRSVPSLSLQLAFHGSDLAIHAQSQLWVQWTPTGNVGGPYPSVSKGWPNGTIFHTFSHPGNHPVTVIERWAVTWSFDGSSGTLPTVIRTTTLALRVQTLRRMLVAPG